MKTIRKCKEDILKGGPDKEPILAWTANRKRDKSISKEENLGKLSQMAMQSINAIGAEMESIGLSANEMLC